VRLGRYVLQEALGEGATATVFRSFHELLSMPVAIKVFEPLDASSDPEGATRFRREAQTLVRLQHPNIVRIVDVDVADGLPFIVMEYVGETTLATQIQNMGRLPAPRIAQIGLAVVDALEAATHQGLLHRDVKPSNILERKDGHIKLVDFGIAARRTTGGVLSDPLAALGLVSGTPAYIAPEQALRPSQIDFRADMYSLGATLYHAATGRPLFQCNTAQELLMAHINESPVHINDIEPGFDPQLSFVIHHMLAKQPEHRFGSWQEVRDALSQSLHRQDEPELLITQTSTGVDLPRPAEDSSGADGMAPHTGAAPSALEKGVSQEVMGRPSATSLRVARASSSSLEIVKPFPGAADGLRASGSHALVTRGVHGEPVSARPQPSPEPAPIDAAAAKSSTLAAAPLASAAPRTGKLQQLTAQLLTSWRASPQSEQRLAIAAVTLLIVTTLFLFLFSGRG
jgi:serine/threonine protein kinase